MKVGRQEVSLGLVTGVTVKLGDSASKQRLGPVGETCGDEAVSRSLGSPNIE